MLNQELWFRIITDQSHCPTIDVDGIQYKTSIHLRKISNLPVTSCKFILPKEARRILYGEHSINLPSNSITKILIIGDTGCRIKGTYNQNCKEDWPFAQIIKMAAVHEPDLIIHLGDYVYREFCRSLTCTDEFVGDNWNTWNNEFFKPATILLGQAPWVIVRGNHELCSRAGKGWTHFFDHRTKCHTHTPPYAIDISSDLRFIIADSAEKNQSKKHWDEINALAEDKQSWLFTHKPAWVTKKETIETYTEPQLISTNISTIFSGHIHLFQLSENADKQQVIIGNSGTKLYEWPPSHLTENVFGFVILEKQIDKNWQLNLFNVNNDLLASHNIK